MGETDGGLCKSIHFALYFDVLCPLRVVYCSSGCFWGVGDIKYSGVKKSVIVVDITRSLHT